MKREIVYAAWFQQVESIGDRSLYALKAKFGSFELAFKAKEEVLKSVLSEKQIFHFKEAQKQISPKDYMESILQKGIV